VHGFSLLVDVPTVYGRYSPSSITLDFDYLPTPSIRRVTVKHVDTEVHYHIRWFRRSELDWESFSTREEADTGARRLMRPNERYTIEQQSDEGCARCNTLRLPPQSLKSRTKIGHRRISGRWWFLQRTPENGRRGGGNGKHQNGEVVEE
jgi:hypothetical protein